MKHVLVSVANREISVSYFDSFEAASAALKEKVDEVVKEHDLDPSEWNIEESEDSAWANYRKCDYDWHIFAVV